MNNSSNNTLVETVTLSQAKDLIKVLSAQQSILILILSEPGIGKSDTVRQAATEAGLACRSLLGTQIAPEDVSGIPRIVGERSIFCPPRVLLPENPEPFVLFLDELPACTPDIQKAFYSLLLERRLGEHSLPPGTWVVAAGNRMEDRALVRGMSSALINRVTILNVRVDWKEWMAWAKVHGVRTEILAYITFMREALMRPIPPSSTPFSTPRAWKLLSEALDLAEQKGLLSNPIRRALAFGRINPEDAAVFCLMEENQITGIRPFTDYVIQPNLLPEKASHLWFVLSGIRNRVHCGELEGVDAAVINRFLQHLSPDHRFSLLVDLVPQWGRLGANEVILKSLKEVTGL